MNNLPTSNSNANARIPAAIVTITVTALVVLLLVLVRMGIDPTRTWPPEPDPYIELAQVDEFIEPEPVDIPSNAPEALDAPAQLPEDNLQDSKTDAQSGTQLENRGPKAEPAKTVTTPKESTVKATPAPQPQKTGATAENPKKQAEPTAPNTKNKEVANAFGGKNNANTGTNDTGKSGKTTGNPASGGPANSTSTTVGMSKGRLGGGWLWPSYAEFTNPTTLKGTIVVEMVIDRNGNPTVKATSGSLANNDTLRNKCIAIAKSRKFANNFADPEKIPEQTTAKLTFTFK